jgi:proteasome lid subunit RPN8/RPN11
MVISERALADMLSHARDEAPRECCGLLVGRRDEIERTVRARNLETRPARYLIDPEDHFAAIRDARSDGREVIGAYHSHPASAPVPSPTDLAEANSGSDFIYVIVSLIGNDVRAYRFHNSEIVLLPLALSSESGRG